MNLGFKLDGMPSEEVGPLARAIEDAGLDEVWMVEDFGLAGGMAQCAVALGQTDHILVGIGILPAAVRNVFYSAMDIATLCRTYPGRFLPGIGHGMPHWLEQVGAHPKSLMAALSEVAEVTGRLLAGETVSFDGEFVHVRDVTLTYPPLEPPIISLGVRGPQGLRVAGKVADGVILAEGSGPRYVKAARRVVGPDSRVTVYSWFSIDDDPSFARSRVEPMVSDALEQGFMQSQVSEFGDIGAKDWVISELSVSGNARECADAILRLREAGADSVVLQPTHGLELDQLDKCSRKVLPLLNVV
jgi:5,10-methylenetetrahydromethanopterin reductase